MFRDGGMWQQIEGEERAAHRVHPLPLCKLKKPGRQALQSRPATLE